MVRLPVNVLIYLLALLSSTGALALLARSGVAAFAFDGDVPSSFVAAAFTSLVLLAPITVVQLALISRRNAPRPTLTAWPYLVLVVVTVLVALAGVGPGIAFVTVVPALAAALFWTAGEPLPRARLAWLTGVAAMLAVVALLGGGA